MDWMRMIRHATTVVGGTKKKLFDHTTMLRLQEGIVAGAATHRGDVRLIVESALPLRKAISSMTTRQRALDLFGTFRVWDTEENNGVLLYVNLAERAVEVIADREASRRTGDQPWLFACQLAQEAFKRGQFVDGVVVALDALDRAMANAFPAELQRRREPLRETSAVG